MSKDARVKNLRPFKKGQSGNPGGRPKGIVTLVRESTKDGAELVEFHLGLMRDVGAAMTERLKAAAWLADRGFGKAVEEVKMTTEGKTESVIRYVNDWRAEA